MKKNAFIYLLKSFTQTLPNLIYHNKGEIFSVKFDRKNVQQYLTNGLPLKLIIFFYFARIRFMNE